MPDTPKVVDREALKEFRKKTDQRYVLEGEYSPNTKVGESDVAKNLTPYSEQSGATDTTPFVFQSTAGGSDVGDLCQLKSLRGQSYVLNQYSKNDKATFTPAGSGVTVTNNGDGTYSVSGTCLSDVNIPLSSESILVKEGHKYLLKNIYEYDGGVNNDFYLQISPNATLNLRTYDGLGNIVDASSDGTVSTYLQVKQGAVLDNLKIAPQLIDLTLMFGAGKEPTTVEEFNRLFPLSYYAYNAGELVSCQANKLITVGYNQFNGNWVIGGWNSDGTDNSNVTNCKSGFIKVIPGQEYSFESGTLTSNANNGRYVAEYDENKNFIKGNYSLGNLSQVVRTITLTKNTHYVKIRYYIEGYDFTDNFPADTSFHLTWDGSKTGYEPYSKHEYGLPNEVLRSVGSVYDELKPDGTLVRRIGVVDLGTLNGWSNYGTGLNTERITTSALSSLIKSTQATVIGNLLSKFEAIKYNDLYGSYKNGIALDGTNLFIKDPSILGLTTNEQIKAALSGVYLFYELAEPTTEEVAPFVENITIDDWGTMEFDSTYPQGNDFFYYVDYKAFIDSLGNREDIGFDSSKIVSQEQLNDAVGDIDLSDYVTTDTDQTLAGAKTVEDVPISFKHTSAPGTASYQIEENQYGQLVISRTYNGTKTAMWVIDGYKLLPNGDNVSDIGQNSKRIKDIFLSGVIDFGSNAKILKDSSDRIVIQFGGSDRVKIGSGNIGIVGRLDPDSDGAYDIGRNSVRWKDIYLSGKIKDGTNEVSVADLKALIDYAKTQGWIQ